MKISLYVRVHIQTTPWRWSFGNLGIGFPISVSALTSASALDFFLPFEALSFAFWSFLWSKTSMVKSFSKTLASFPERVCCSLEQLFCSDVVSACFWRKELRYECYLTISGVLKTPKTESCSLYVCVFLIRNQIRDHFLEIFCKFQNIFKKFS